MKVTLENGNSVEIKAPGVSDRNRYIKRVKLNGKTYSKLYISHEDLLQGCTIEFEMTDRPARKRGLAKEDKP
jgi:putative alpha-1,2-mannosidase